MSLQRKPSKLFRTMDIEKGTTLPSQKYKIGEYLLIDQKRY